jgi:hypothetical protein
MIKEVKAGNELVDTLRERIQMGQSKQIAKVAFVRLPASRVKTYLAGLDRGMEMSGRVTALHLIRVKYRREEWIFEGELDLIRQLLDMQIVHKKYTRDSLFKAVCKVYDKIINNPTKLHTMWPDLPMMPMEGVNLDEVRAYIRRYLADGYISADMNQLNTLLAHPLMDDTIWDNVSHVIKVHK